MVRPSNKNAHVGQAKDIVMGTMFKSGNAWYLAAQKVTRETDMPACDWSVRAYTKTGQLTWVPIYGDEVELPNQGYIPPCFRATSVRREARTLAAQIESLKAQQASMEKFANALEKVGY